MVKSHNQKVAVIGAGLAGLTAAYRLMQHGLEVDLFEAGSRAGGRVFTILMENYLGRLTEIELGGQNITDGGEAGHFLKLTKEFNLDIQEKIIDINQIVYSQKRTEYYNKLVAEHPKNILDLKLLADKADNIGQLIELFCDDNKLLQEALLSRIMAYEGVTPYKQSIYHNLETLECTLSGGVAKAHEYYDHKPDQVITSFIKGGNARLPLEIAKHLEGKIYYNRPLNKITLKEGYATLIFNDQIERDYEYVIFAIPAATFNNIDFSNFSIAQEKIQKISSIAYGPNYKIALPLNLTQTNNISSVIKDNVISFYNQDKTIQILYVNDKKPNIKNFVRVLSESYGHTVEPSSDSLKEAEDKNYKVYNQNIYFDWKSNPYFQGSYSGYSTTISAELDETQNHFGTLYKTLFLPINNILFFAGEHTTILPCIGTMEAAVESGERIAKAVHQVATHAVNVQA